MAGLERFVQGQDPAYETALVELREGEKRSHWMWFVFPQIRGLGHSAMARRFAIADLREARAYRDHDVLGPRLRESTAAVLHWEGQRSLHEILGPIDTLKFASCMTLFEAAGGGADFAYALDSFCAGERDARTLEILQAMA